MRFFVESSFLVFLILTVILGGGAAYMAGAALARGWKSKGLLVAYMIIFTAGVRFLHYALFQANLTSGQYFFSHGLVILAAALLGYQITRTNQMTTQYPWLYERSGLLSWRQKS